MRNLNPYTGVPYQSGVFEAEPSNILPEAQTNFYKELWAISPLTHKFNIARRQWQFPIWPKINLNFIKEK